MTSSDERGINCQKMYQKIVTIFVQQVVRSICYDFVCQFCNSNYFGCVFTFYVYSNSDVKFVRLAFNNFKYGEQKHKNILKMY